MLSNKEENLNTPPNLGIIAGGGLLPSEIASLHQNLGGKVFIAALEGEADISSITSYTYKQFPMGSVGALLEYFVANNVQIAGQGGVIQDIREPGIMGGTPAVPIRDWHKQTIMLRKLINEKKK